MRNLSLALLLLGCGARAPVDDRDPPPPPRCDSSLGEGQRPWIFALLPAAGMQPMAAGGASYRWFAMTAHADRVIELRSSDERVITFVMQRADEEAPCPNQYEFDAVSGAPGAADLILIGADGAEIGRQPFRVEATAKLGIDREWSVPGGPRALAGSLQAMHVTTFDTAGKILTGTGAVSFELDGALWPVVDADKPPFSGGDAVSFTGQVGSATITARCFDATLTRSIQFVDPDEVTELSMTARSELWGAFLDVRALVGGEAIYGAHCEFRGTLGLEITWFSGGWVGVEPTTVYYVAGPKGRHTVLCEIGRASAAATVEIK